MYTGLNVKNKTRHDNTFMKIEKNNLKIHQTLTI